ncbi:MAG: acetylesterase [Lachnospiraceae bacterium]|nr:acetylesterase [Lachnospiraceae bacterium]
MALIQVNYLSCALYRTVPVNVVLPIDRIDYDKAEYLSQSRGPFKTLYLLHGLLGNHTDWISGSRIQRWAEEKNLAVVMPSGENAFYFDGRNPHSDYGRFIGEELPDITRRMFPLSDKREDTYIAGLSMGGYGAIRNGIVYSDKFSHVAGLSAAVHFFEYEEEDENVLGLLDDKEYAKKTDLNPKVAIDELIAQKRPMPEFYLACGRQDDLMPANEDLRDYLIEKGADVTWVEEDAGHEWDFWDDQIRKVLEWLPL